MNSAAEYLARIEALIVGNPCVCNWQIIREEAQGNLGLFRYRLELSGGAMVEMFEKFRIVSGDVNVSKYSFHWQDDDGDLIKRWDNAAHHPEIAGYPHHVHHRETDVSPSRPMNAEVVLNVISERQAGC